MAMLLRCCKAILAQLLLVYHRIKSIGILNIDDDMTNLANPNSMPDVVQEIAKRKWCRSWVSLFHLLLCQTLWNKPSSPVLHAFSTYKKKNDVHIFLSSIVPSWKATLVLRCFFHFHLPIRFLFIWVERSYAFSPSPIFEGLLQVSKHLCGPTLDHSLTYVVYKPLGSQLVLLLWVYFLCHLASIFNPKYLTPLHFTVHCNMFVRWSNDTQHQVLDETFKLFFDHGL